MILNAALERRLRAAIRQFWTTRDNQAKKQGTARGTKDAGARAAVTGGAQMDGFVALVHDLLNESGLDRAHVYCEGYLEVPGWYRPERNGTYSWLATGS